MRTDSQGTNWWTDFWNRVWGIAVSALVAVVSTGLTFYAAITVAGSGDILAGVALMSAAIGMGFGAVSGGISAAINGTSISGGILSGTIKGATIGASAGLGIVTGASMDSPSLGFAAFGGAVAINFIAGMLSYAIENSMNGRPMNWGDAFANGGLQALIGIFAFSAGVFVGASGFYNIPGQTKFLSGPWFGNLAVMQLVKAILYYPLKWVFDFLRKRFFSGNKNENRIKIQ